MSRRKIESPSFASSEEYRQMETNVSQSQTSERKSVFERLGRITRTIDTTRRVVTTRNDYEETDLRFKVRRKRTNDKNASPNRSPLSPQSRPQQSGVKSITHKTDDNKVKSLVLAPNRRSESPTIHSQNVISSSSSSSLKRPKLSSSEQKFANSKWEDDIDDEELEKKRLQLQRELQELEFSGSSEHQEKSDCLPSIVTNCDDIRSRSSSTLSSESGSYSSSIKSFSKTESTTSSNTDKKSNMKSSNKECNRGSDKRTEKKAHVSSSISRKLSNFDDSSHKKSSELKFDRHGNLRVSLDEQERQKRIRAERFSEKKFSQIDLSKKKSTLDPNSIEHKSGLSRDHSYSPPAKRARESKDKSDPGKHRESSEKLKIDRKYDHKSKTDSKSSKYESSPRSRSSEKTDDRRNKYDDKRDKGSERSRSSLLSVSPNYRSKRDHSGDSRFSDRDNSSVTSRPEQRRSKTYSRDQSPAHSSHSKISRDSSIGSDFSRRSKSERLSIQSHERLTESQNVEPKNSEVKVSDPIIEEMSPISADSSIPDVTEIDSPKIESKISVQKEETLISNRFDAKDEDESNDDFSDWSEGEDELLLKTDGFETLDEVRNMSETPSKEKESWNEKSERKRSDNSDNEYPSDGKDDALEAISDDELDAIIGETEPMESSIDPKKSSSNREMLDSLEIDWASLVSEPKTKLEFIPGSARKRFTPANVLMRIGFSQAFAGPLVTTQIIDFCQNELKQDFVPFRHPMAAVHSLINERIKERRYLFQVDTHSTALSGRKDLQIRKMLNKSSFKIFDNSLTSTASTTTATSVNEFSDSSTNIKQSNAADIQCF